MYYYIEGTVTYKSFDFLVVDAGGVGYKIGMADSSISKVSVGEKRRIFTYLNVREDAMDLYGFLTEEELNLFRLLISVSGIGPKVGLGILSAISPSEFALAVVTGNVKAITKAPGVGPKVAQRIILELKDKLKNTDLGAAVSEIRLGAETVAENDNRAEAVSALMVLGYSDREAAAALSGLDASLDTEELIKLALKNMI